MKLRKVFKPYNIAIILCALVAIISIAILITPKTKKQVTPAGTEIVDAGLNENEEISEEKAREIAKKQFKELGENIDTSEMQVTKINRKQTEYYYITSKNNTVEIEIKGGKVYMINNVPVVAKEQ